MRQDHYRITTDDIEDGSISPAKISAAGAGASLTFSSPVNESDDLALPVPWPNVGRLFVTLAAGNANWTGLAGGVDGMSVLLKNIDSANSLTLNSENANSHPANRFNGIGDQLIPPGSSVLLVYTAGSRNRWDIH